MPSHDAPRPLHGRPTAAGGQPLPSRPAAPAPQAAPGRAPWLPLVVLVLGVACPAAAQPAAPRADTPTLFGAQRVAPGDLVVGVHSGFPKTGMHLFVGLAERFDVGFLTSVTYGDSLGGYRQRVGFDLHVPLRWTVLERNDLALGLRVSPYFLVGEGGPGVSVGADLAVLFDVALPKVFKLIFGPELRTGFADGGRRPRASGYDGALWFTVGLEALLKRRWYVGWQFQGGAYWGSGGLPEGGLFRANVYFGYAF